MKFKAVQKMIDKIRGKKEEKQLTSECSKESIWYLSTSGKIGADNFPICLSDTERKFLVNNIKDAKKYLEFGSGGSTYIALTQTNIPNILSVESDKNWIKHLETFDVITQNKERLNFLHIDIGKTGDWGMPVEMDKKELWPNFSEQPFKSKKDWDVILIDGRFRVACALQAILNSKKNVKILMHDFNNRPEYHDILRFLDIVDTADTMCMFKIKDNYDKQAVVDLYNTFKYNFD